MGRLKQYDDQHPPLPADEAPADEDPLSAFLGEWLHHLGDSSSSSSPGGPPRSMSARLFAHMRESRPSQWSLWLVSVVSFVDVVMLVARGDPLSTSVPVRTFIGGYSCSVAQFILVHRKGVVLQALRRARRTATELHDQAVQAGSKDASARFAAEAKQARVLHWRVAPYYATVVDVGVLFTLLNDVDSATNTWIREYTGAVAWWQPWGPEVFHAAKWLFEAYSVSCCIACLFTVLLVEQALHGASVVLMGEVGRRFQETHAHASPGFMATTVRLHLEVLSTCTDVNRMFGLLLPHYLLISVLMSLLSTVAVLTADGIPDGFAMACSLYLFIFFVPMCAVGQRLEDSSKAVAARTYGGPWPEEGPAARRDRLLVMTSAARPASFSVPGVGSLNKPTCRRGIRSWFQFVQIFINVRSRRWPPHPHPA